MIGASAPDRASRPPGAADGTASVHGLRRAMFGHALRAGAVIVVGLSICAFVQGSARDAYTLDFGVFYDAGRYVLGIRPRLYLPAAAAANPFDPIFKLPPTTAVLMAPLSMLPQDDALRLWRALLQLSYWGALILLCRSWGVSLLSWTGLVAMLAWAWCIPARASIENGQWDPVLLLLLSAATVAASVAHLHLAGLALALAASVKLYPAILFITLVARRAWGPLLVSLCCLALLLTVGGAAVGRYELRQWLTQILPASGATTAFPENQALGGMVARAVVGEVNDLLPMRGQPAIDAGIRLMGAVLCGTVAWLNWRAGRPLLPGSPSGRLHAALAFVLPVPLLVLALPVAWTHYLTVLLLPLFLLLIRLCRRPPGEDAASRLRWLVLLVAYGLVAGPYPSAPDMAGSLGHTLSTIVRQIMLSYQTLGAMLVLILVGLAVRETAPARAVPAWAQQGPHAGAPVASAPQATRSFRR